ncbi:hypothetical protein FRC03_000421 [Tulasnella sp. 419]|nr:hypothetical protein FRC03_000419 [Tulasnella sp. 419]KAG8949143.1 hypothetical protein FRC03_000421 [Tulasnella sp. 419]
MSRNIAQLDTAPPKRTARRRLTARTFQKLETLGGSTGEAGSSPVPAEKAIPVFAISFRRRHSLQFGLTSPLQPPTFMIFPTAPAQPESPSGFIKYLQSPHVYAPFLALKFCKVPSNASLKCRVPSWTTTNASRFGSATLSCPSQPTTTTSGKRRRDDREDVDAGFTRHLKAPRVSLDDQLPWLPLPGRRAGLRPKYSNNGPQDAGSARFATFSPDTLPELRLAMTLRTRKVKKNAKVTHTYGVRGRGLIGRFVEACVRRVWRFNPGDVLRR